MGKIKILSPDVIDKIAAGEVIERPASIVKELIENSIDAQASKVKIEIARAGKKMIQIVDDGEGMDREDVKKCFQRHGTSKLSSVDDLIAIKTLGFRGEALSSIAAVAKMVVISKQTGETAGVKAEIQAGKLKNLTPVGTAKGTMVQVKDLFYNLPARRKFIKTDRTEFRHILDIFNSYALAFPEIGFSLFHDKREVQNLSKNQQLANRVGFLLGEDIKAALIKVFFEHPHLKVRGYITKPQIASKARFNQYIFINKRRIKDRIVAAAVSQAYETLIPKRAYPPFILFLQLSPDLIDVNVHPRKEEVKFVNESFIYRHVKEAVSHALAQKDLTFKPKGIREYRPPFAEDSKKKFKLKEPTPYFGRSESLTEIIARSPSLDAAEDFPQTLPWQETPITPSQSVIQVHNLYLITQTAKGILILDQHAAHERTLYEKYLTNFKQNKKIGKQALLIPESLWLSSPEAECLRENQQIFVKLGFEIEDLGKNNFKITSIPAVLCGKKIGSLVKEIIDDLRQETEAKDIDDMSQLAISYLACRSAVKAGDNLSRKECQEIIDDLNRSKIKYTCPHGRPTKVELTLEELAKMFGRI